MRQIRSLFEAYSKKEGIVVSKQEALIPRDIPFGNPERANPQISPDGTKKIPSRRVFPYNDPTVTLDVSS
jgi:hypothetical protein